MGSPATLFIIGVISVLGINPKSNKRLLTLFLQFISFITPVVLSFYLVNGIELIILTLLRI